MSLEQIIIALCGGFIGGSIVSIILWKIGGPKKKTAQDPVDSKRQEIIDEISQRCTSVERLIQTHAGSSVAHSAFRNALISEIELISRKLKPNLAILDIYYAKYIEAQIREYLSFSVQTTAIAANAVVEKKLADQATETDAVSALDQATQPPATAHDLVESTLDAETTAQTLTDINTALSESAPEEPMQIEETLPPVSNEKPQPEESPEPAKTSPEDTILFKPDTPMFTLRSGAHQSPGETIASKIDADFNAMLKKNDLSSPPPSNEEPVLITDETMILNRADLFKENAKDLDEDEMPVVNRYHAIKRAAPPESIANKAPISGDDVAEKLDSIFGFDPK